MERDNLIFLVCFIGIYNNGVAVTVTQENTTQYSTTISPLNLFNSTATKVDTNTSYVTSTSHITTTVLASTTVVDKNDSSTAAYNKNVTGSSKDSPKDPGDIKNSSITTEPTPISLDTNTSTTTAGLNNTNSSTTTPIVILTTLISSSTSTTASNVSSTISSPTKSTSNSTTIQLPTSSSTSSLPVSTAPTITTSTENLSTASNTQMLSALPSQPSTTSTERSVTSGKSGAIVTTTESKKGTTETSDSGSGVQISGKKTCEDSAFGKLGLIVFIALSIVCIILMVAVIFLILKHTKRTKRGVKVIEEEEKNVPKLKMLEIKDTPVKTYSKSGGGDDGLQTFSLDYEQYVQQKKEEHKRKVAQTNSVNTTSSDGQAVSSFLIGKRPLMMQTTSGSGGSSPRSPNSPKSPAGVSGLKVGQGEDEPVVFNFTKTPGESLAARRASKPTQDDRRRSSTPSAKNAKGLELSPDNFTIDL